MGEKFDNNQKRLSSGHGPNRDHKMRTNQISLLLLTLLSFFTTKEAVTLTGKASENNDCNCGPDAATCAKDITKEQMYAKYGEPELGLLQINRTARADPKGTSDDPLFLYVASSKWGEGRLSTARKIWGNNGFSGINLQNNLKTPYKQDVKYIGYDGFVFISAHGGAYTICLNEDGDCVRGDEFYDYVLAPIFANAQTPTFIVLMACHTGHKKGGLVDEIACILKKKGHTTTGVIGPKGYVNRDNGASQLTVSADKNKKKQLGNYISEVSEELSLGLGIERLL